MTMSFVASLDEEIARLEDAISDIPEVKKLRELKRLRQLYDGPRRLTEQDELQEPYDSSETPARAGGRKPSPERQEALKIIEAAVVGAKVPMRTVDLLALLRNRGIKIGGSDEISNLSAMISSSGRFEAHGRSGWTLKEVASQAVLSQPGVLTKDSFD
jgi:hypothetical protein